MMRILTQSRMLLPRPLTKESNINVVYTSSIVYPNEQRDYQKNLKQLKETYPETKIFELRREGFNLSYLAASEKERLHQLRLAIKEADWLLPATGGTGCNDVLRRMNDNDLANIRKHRPIVSGFSDSTALLNYLYFKLKLVSFHYHNADALFNSKNNALFFDVLQGKVDRLSFSEPSYHWLTSAHPAKPLEGIAIGGNFSTFRDLLDVCEIRPRSWEPYILFIEELDMDVEDLHRLIIALDARGVFRHIVALVIGRFDDSKHASTFRRLQKLFTRKEQPQETPEVKNVFEYLISDVIDDRIKERDPLYILRINNFGHSDGAIKEPIIIPIGAKTIIHPDGRIEFIGPFVSEENGMNVPVQTKPSPSHPSPTS